MTEPLFLRDAHLREAEAKVIAASECAVTLDRSIFYPRGGGQPGDVGSIHWDGGSAEVTDMLKGENGAIVLQIGDNADLPAPGTAVIQRLNWEKRLRHMRVHTALHLLSVVIPLPVTGGSITAEKGRLDFDMPDAPEDKEALQDALNALIARDFEISETWITDEELDANPGLVKTMSVRPPRGAGKVRLVRIGTPEEQIDLQPCGGTHVAHTSEIGPIRLGKIEKKGARNRRVNIFLTF